MNLNSLANGVTSAVNANTPAVLQLSAGRTINPDGTQTPKYAQPSIPVFAQVQELSTKDLHQIEGLNLAGTKVSIYLNGQVQGVVRAQNKGGDLITVSTGPRAGVYLVAAVLEQFADWVKVAATLQNGS